MIIVLDSSFRVVSLRSLEIKRGDDADFQLYFLSEEGENIKPVLFDEGAYGGSVLLLVLA